MKPGSMLKSFKKPTKTVDEEVKEIKKPGASLKKLHPSKGAKRAAYVG